MEIEINQKYSIKINEQELERLRNILKQASEHLVLNKDELYLANAFIDFFEKKEDKSCQDILESC